MIAKDFYHVTTGASLAVIGGTLLAAIAASFIVRKRGLLSLETGR
mgnify:FL=1